MIADALEEEHPESPLPNLIREQYGLGEHAEKGPKNNLWYEPFNNSWDGTFPYTAEVGHDGPFRLLLGHESPPFSGVGFADGGNYSTGNERWVVHAVSTLPGSRDSGYTFEFPHEEAHRIPQLFPAAAAHVDSREFPFDPRLPNYHREERRQDEANKFNDLMDEQERNR